MKIRNVSPTEWGRIDGHINDMPWLLAERKFKKPFRIKEDGSAVWEQVMRNYGCFASNANDWTSGINRIINILNGLPSDTSEENIKRALGLRTGGL